MNANPSYGAAAGIVATSNSGSFGVATLISGADFVTGMLFKNIVLDGVTYLIAALISPTVIHVLPNITGAVQQVYTCTFDTPTYYTSLITSEYQFAVKFLSWLTDNLSFIQEIAACSQEFFTAFDLLTAIGPQLDVLGAYIGQSRQMSFQPTLASQIQTAIKVAGGTGYAVGDIVTVVQGSAGQGRLQIATVGGGGAVTGVSRIASSLGIGYAAGSGLATTTTGGGTGLTVTITVGAGVSPTLDDTTYRTLLLCQIFKNHWDGQIDSIQAFWSMVFTPGTLAILDYQSMKVAIIVSQSLSGILQDIAINDLLFARPQCVLYLYALQP